MKIKFFKKVNSFKKKDFQLDPNIYWKAALGGTLLVIIFSLFFGYSLFMQINDDSLPAGAGVSVQAPMVNKDRIEKTLNYFSDRQQKSIQIINSHSPVVDPSR